jgi:hypothetical protein
VKGAAFEYCDVLGQLLNLDIWMGKTKILHVPWGITKNKEDLGRLILELQVQFSYLHGFLPHYTTND